jgi:hypothetical protein
LSWVDLVRRYVWHEERTPYLRRSDRLTQGQARSELFVYAFLLATLGSAVAVAAASGRLWPGPLGPALAVYAGTLAAGAVVLGVTAHPAAARYCVTAPLVLAAGAVAGAVRPEMGPGERLVVGALAGLWVAYALRVVRISRGLARRG